MRIGSSLLGGVIAVGLTAMGAPATAADEPSRAPLAVPEPELLPRGRVEERGESPRFYTLSPPSGWLASRIGVGGAARFAGEHDGGAFAFDVTLGARLGLHRSEQLMWALMPDVGYANVALGARSSSHLARAGLGLGKSFRAVAIGVVPRFVYGTAAGERAAGMQTALLVDGAPEPGIVFELSHTALWTDLGASHDLRFVIGIDPLLFFTQRECRVRLYGPWGKTCGH